MRRLFQLIHKVEEWLLASAMIAMAALIIANVISRVAFDASLAFAEELAQFLIILICFVGLSYGASQGRHIRMTALYDQFGRRGRKTLMLAISAVTAVLMFLLAWYAVQYIRTVYTLYTVSPVLRVPLYLVYLSAPVGLVLGGIQYVLTFWRNLHEEDVYLSFEKKDTYEEPVVPEI